MGGIGCAGQWRQWHWLCAWVWVLAGFCGAEARESMNGRSPNFEQIERDWNSAFARARESAETLELHIRALSEDNESLLLKSKALEQRLEESVKASEEQERQLVEQSRKLQTLGTYSTSLEESWSNYSRRSTQVIENMAWELQQERRAVRRNSLAWKIGIPAAGILGLAGGLSLGGTL